MNISKIILPYICIFPALTFAQTSVTLQGNLTVADDPNTESHVEGNTRITGSLVLGSSIYTMAFGENSIASGTQAQAWGYRSIAVGDWNTRAYGNYSIAYGWDSIAGVNGSTLEHCFAYGPGTRATGTRSVAMGSGAQATGNYSVAMGAGPKASGGHSISLGCYSEATGWMSAGIGSHTVANGDSSFAIGYNVQTKSHNAYAFGKNAISNAWGSFAIGYDVSSDTYYQTTLGVNNLPISGDKSKWVATNPLLVIGNGSAPENKSNALVMLKNGDTKFSGNIEAESIKVRTAKGGLPMGEFGLPN
jgi:Hep_Hag.